MFSISNEAIDVGAFRRDLHDPSCGALVLFEGLVRNHNEGRAVDRLEYEVYEPLAVSEGQRVLAEAAERFDIVASAGIHRHGLLSLEEPAVIVGVISHHRSAAFDACRYIIDEIKVRLPIWKKEYYSDGTTEWVNCRQCAAHRH